MRAFRESVASGARKLRGAAQLQALSGGLELLLADITVLIELFQVANRFTETLRCRQNVG
jgi:hypothetical protein